MPAQPFTAVMATLSYIGIWVLIGEIMNRRGARPLFSRKLVHLGASGSIFIFAFGFEDLEAALATIAFITALAIADRSRHVFRGIQSEDSQNLGTVWFWVAMLLSVAVLWDQPRLMIAAIVPMAVGDPLAGLVGATWGKRHYEIGTHSRTVEGSLTFVASTLPLTLAALALIHSSPDVALPAAVAAATAISAVGAAIEAVSRWGVDNLAITVASVLILLVLL